MLYLIAIPLFAAIYAVMWRDFYQSTSTVDPAAARVERAALDEVMGQISSWLPRNDIRFADVNLSNFHPEPVDPKFGSMIIRQSVTVMVDGQPKTAIIDWNVSLLTSSADPGAPLPVRITSLLPEVVHLMRRSRRDEFDEVGQFGGLRGRLVGPGGNTSPELANGYIDGEWVPGDNVAKQLREYLDTMRGKPSPPRFGYGKYVYLSVVTITTLGFGDMVPVSDGARTVIAIEALFGVVVAGLFLNALARQLGANQRPNDNQGG